MDFLRRNQRVFSSDTRAVSSVSGSFNRVGLGKVLAPFTQILDKVGKLPRIGPLFSMATPFLSKLGPLAFVAGGPLGVALGVISKVGTAKTLLDIVGGFIRGGGGPDKFPAQARNNIAHGSAWQQAKMLRRI